MKNTFIKLSVQRSLRNNSVNRSTGPFKGVRSAGIVFTGGNPEKSGAVLEIRNQLESEGIRTSLLEFQEKKGIAGTDCLSFSPDDFSIWGKLRNADVEAFTLEQFDYLYVADRELHPAVQLVLAGSKARCRAGICTEETRPLLDVMIQSEGEHSQVMNDLLQLTKKLQ